jgi:hypothetical protein
MEKLEGLTAVYLLVYPAGYKLRVYTLADNSRNRSVSAVEIGSF